MFCVYVWMTVKLLTVVVQKCFFRPQGKVIFSEAFVCSRGGGGLYCHLVATTAAISTHPTGMHSCLLMILQNLDLMVGFLMSSFCIRPRTDLLQTTCGHSSVKVIVIVNSMFYCKKYNRQDVHETWSFSSMVVHESLVCNKSVKTSR